MTYKKSFLIYGLLSPITGELKYIGKSSSGLNRPKHHCVPSALKVYNNRYPKLQAWLKSLFNKNLKPKIIVIEDNLLEETLADSEIFWIAYYRSIGCLLLNMTDGGEGANGLKQKPESICKRSKKMKEHWSKPEYKERVSLSIKKAYSNGNWAKGRKQSKETINKRVQKLIGKKRTEEQIQHIRNIQKNKKAIKDQYGNIYDSIADASRKINSTRRNIKLVIKGIFKQIKGYRFEYAK